MSRELSPASFPTPHTVRESAYQQIFPEQVTITVGDGNEERPCFSPAGFRYVVALVQSRVCFVDGALRLLPYLNHANHANHDSYEVQGGGVGALWGFSKGDTGS